MYYEVELHEHRKYILGVDAESPEAAKEKALQRWHDDDYDPNDYEVYDVFAEEGMEID